MRLFQKKPYKTKVHQTGTTNLAIDKQFIARKTGRRISKSGKTYYEYRRNRSDVGVRV